MFKKAENLANHVAIVLDASYSMHHLTNKVIEVVDRQVAGLAKESQQYKQETRISIWVFADAGTVQCVVWDTDVLRLPSIADLYQPNGNTALIDATLKSIDDLKTVSQIYGDHSFLVLVVTDGEENNSFVKDPLVISSKINELPKNWTVAALVPNVKGVAMAKRFGFPAGNIQMWDASSEQGLEEAHNTITTAYDSYMRGRASGTRSTTSFFDMSAAAVNKQTIQAAGLTPLGKNDYKLVHVEFPNFRPGDDRIDNFTARMGFQYIVGRGFYQLTLEPVKVQPNKDVAVVDKKSKLVYTGTNARALLGLPDNMSVTLRAGQNPDYDIFIQSTSLNRKLLERSDYLYLTPQVTYVKQPPAPVVSQAYLTPKVAKMPPASPKVAVSVPVVSGSKKKTRPDLTAPVYPKAGKALWAAKKCPVCPSPAFKRCQQDNGSPLEKPHAERKV